MITRILLVLTVVAGLGLSAHADTLVPGTKGYGKITRLGRGLKEFGLDTVLVVKSISDSQKGQNGAPDTTTSTLSAAFAGGPTFRYFLIDNLSVAVNASLEIRHAGTSTKVGTDETSTSITGYGAMGTVMLDYYVSLSRGMFFKPGIGGGYFWMTENIPGQSDSGKEIKIAQARSGGIGRLQLGFVYYVSADWNLKATVDILGRFGGLKRDDEETSRTLTEIDAGWNVGFSYVF